MHEYELVAKDIQNNWRGNVIIIFASDPLS